MIDYEPVIKVALLQNYRQYKITLNGYYRLPGGQTIKGLLKISSVPGQVILSDASGSQLAGQKEIFITAQENSTFTVEVKIGIDFHWQRMQTQTFNGSIIFQANPDASSNLVNEIPLEDYIGSVISSEMSAEAPLEFLKAQAITARSWLVAMLERKKRNTGIPPMANALENEIIIWYDTNDHSSFDVCADDHCQRYQGISQITSANVAAAVAATRGIYLVSNDNICDARYYKSCGGRTEIFPTAWEDKTFPFLQSISDDSKSHPPLKTEEDVQNWLTEKPPAYCNTQDQDLLGQILSAFDRETVNFYRWQVGYDREELEGILHRRSGIDFGKLLNLVPVERGPSGRISRKAKASAYGNQISSPARLTLTPIASVSGAFRNCGM